MFASPHSYTTSDLWFLGRRFGTGESERERKGDRKSKEKNGRVFDFTATERDTTTPTNKPALTARQPSSSQHPFSVDVELAYTSLLWFSYRRGFACIPSTYAECVCVCMHVTIYI
jgi:hypothetical protein